MTFVQFLKDNNVYDKYMENFKFENQWWELPALRHRDEKDFIDKNHNIFWVYMAFNWEKSPEGPEFWEDIHEKWIETIDGDIKWE